MLELIDKLKKFEKVEKCVLPVSKKEVSITPYKVRDQKYLSQIGEDQNHVNKILAMVSILKNNSSVNRPEELCLADAEYLFLKIRSISVDNILSVSFTQDEQKITADISIDDIKCDTPELSKEIKVPSHQLSLKLRLPTVNDYLQSDINTEKICSSLIEEVIIGNECYSVSRYVPEEIERFLGELPLSVSTAMKDYMKKVPSLYYDLEQEGKTTRLRGFLNFFQLL